jgi:hypothetical protein
MAQGAPATLVAGERFERLTVVSRSFTRGGNRHWLLRCDCGNEHHAPASALRTGRVKSCGCLNDEMRIARNTTHGLRPRDREASHPLYDRWSAMLARCHTPTNEDFPLYGGRGIKVCERWRNDFRAYVDDVGMPPPGRPTLDRKDNDGDYEPNNVHWATWSEQRLNQRNAHAPRNLRRRLTVGQGAG